MSSEELPLPAVLVVVVLLGLAVGSFLNVVIHRLPRGESLSTPGSHCPRCDTPIRARHNVPVLGWLVLRGRCHTCRAPISPRYPLVEAGTALAFGLLAWARTDQDDPASVPAFVYVAAVAIALALIDLDLRRVPARLVVPALPVTAVLLVGAAVLDGSWGPSGRAVAGALAVALAVAPAARTGRSLLAVGALAGALLGWTSWAALAVGGGLALVVAIGFALTVGRAPSARRAPPVGALVVATLAVGLAVGTLLA